MRVEREVHRTVRDLLLDDDFGSSFAGALEQRPDPDLGADLQEGAGALRSFTRDTGGFVQNYGDLFNDPGVDGWSGPYLEGAPYEAAHPRYGDWQVLQQGDAAAGSFAGCAEFHSGDCGAWLLLSSVPEFVANELDAEFDNADGLAAGRVRYDTEAGTVYFYSLA
jgi:hypothetical protein